MSYCTLEMLRIIFNCHHFDSTKFINLIQKQKDIDQANTFSLLFSTHGSLSNDLIIENEFLSKYVLFHFVEKKCSNCISQYKQNKSKLINKSIIISNDQEDKFELKSTNLKKNWNNFLLNSNLFIKTTKTANNNEQLVLKESIKNNLLVKLQDFENILNHGNMFDGPIKSKLVSILLYFQNSDIMNLFQFYDQYIQHIHVLENENNTLKEQVKQLNSLLQQHYKTSYSSIFALEWLDQLFLKYPKMKDFLYFQYTENDEIIEKQLLKINEENDNDQMAFVPKIVIQQKMFYQKKCLILQRHVQKLWALHLEFLKNYKIILTNNNSVDNMRKLEMLLQSFCQTFDSLQRNFKNRQWLPDIQNLQSYYFHSGNQPNIYSNLFQELFQYASSYDELKIIFDNMFLKCETKQDMISYLQSIIIHSDIYWDSESKHLFQSLINIK